MSPVLAATPQRVLSFPEYPSSGAAGMVPESSTFPAMPVSSSSSSADLAVASSSFSSPALDLTLNLNHNLALFPKLEPKSEPFDDDHRPPQPVRADPLEPGILPQHYEDSMPDDGVADANDDAVDDGDDLFDEYYRSYDCPGTTSREISRAIVPLPQEEYPPSVVAGVSESTAVVAPKKRKPRSSDMVRVNSLGPREQLYFRDLVRRTRITFESLRALILFEDASGVGSGGGGGREKDDASPAVRIRRPRPDARAAMLMGDRDLWLNRDRRIIGSIPGINVGDVFLFRSELCVLGLHGQTQAGIDYVTAACSATGEPIATSIVVSGGYEDDDDKGPLLIYTGHGGRDRNVHRHSTDQKLHGGNLALERSMNYGIEIRVIRGVKYTRSPIGKVYVYDGLYKIVDCWMEAGKSGFGVYKYKMLRIEGQEEMGSATLRFAEELKANPLGVRPKGYLTLDMSNGKENLPVRLFNDIDDDGEPLLFEYLARPVYPLEISKVKQNGDEGIGCQCVLSCSAGCSCIVKNGGEFAYNGNRILVKGKPLIYECGRWCKCPLSCPNRVTQKGLTHRLEVFRSKVTGWGVRSLDLIQAGSFVCEFSGEVRNKLQSEIIAADGGCLVHPGQLPRRWVEWGDISDVQPECMPHNSSFSPDLDFSIDVSRKRNVACYLSHSCAPNVFVQYVMFDHHNISYPHVMVFAMENIPPMRELSIDYGIRDEWIGQLTM